MVLEERCYWKLGPTINGFFKSMADSCPSMDHVVVGASSERRVNLFIGDKINPALDWLVIFVFIPLNHSKSMTRKTPLRSKTPLKRSQGLKRGGRLRNASSKRQREYNEYSKAKKAYLALHPRCERCQNKKSDHIHHKAGRVGQWLCRYEFFAALCFQCHEEVHANPSIARKQGWIIDSHTISLADNSALEDPKSFPLEP